MLRRAPLLQWRIVSSSRPEAFCRRTLSTDDNDYGYQRNTQKSNTAGLVIGAAVCGLAAVYAINQTRRAHADAQAVHGPSSSIDPADNKYRVPERKDLPKFSRDDVKKHGKGAQRIWVTYQDGVYDVTEFRDQHPGGDKILLAAGGAVDAFWSVYAQHKTHEVMEILEGLRIGSLDSYNVEEVQAKDVNDPFSSDPPRHPALIVNAAKPFNAETPPMLLLDSFRTPNELFFVRNHMPVPKTNGASHRLHVEGLGVKKAVDLSVDQLKKKYPQAYITSVVQCAGNRRADMQRYKKVAGLMWEGYAISNAKWTGVRLRDVLISLGVDPNDTRIKHVHLEGADIDPTGKPYGASISFEKAMCPETIIAYEMNDKEIPADHGYPLRLIAPGIVGARQVKWLTTIRLSEEESPSHWQQKDYRAFPPSVGLNDDLDWKSVPAIQEYPIQSAFCTPAQGTTVDRSDGTIDVAGYAWSGGGKGIIRVEVSPDGGKTWYSAELEQDPEQTVDRMFAWTIFRASVPIPEGADTVHLVCKATDRAYNTQPETAAGIWNPRGLLHNAWHRVDVKVNEK